VTRKQSEIVVLNNSTRHAVVELIKPAASAAGYLRDPKNQSLKETD